MKRTLSQSLVAAPVCCLVVLWHISTAAITLESSMTMRNAAFTPQSGSIVWLTDWQLEAAVGAFDSASGSASSYDSWYGQPGAVGASASTSHASGNARASVDAAGNPVELHTDYTVDIPPSLEFASAFCAATAYREFSITGGTGSTGVRFSFDYEALLRNIGGLSYGLDYVAGIRITDGSATWNLLASGEAFGPVDRTDSGSLDQTFDLEYDVPYSITLIKDENPPTPPPISAPDGGATIWLASPVFFALILARALAGVRGPRQAESPAAVASHLTPCMRSRSTY